jgi:cephalosporin-C deacetylase-like acetyl esterase
MNRRDFVKQAGILPLAAGLPAGGVGVPSDKPAQPGIARLYSQMMPDMLVSFLTERANAVAAHWDRKRAQIHTPRQMEARNRFVRQKCIEMIHGLPKRNPLNPIIVKSFERHGYKVENLMYESQPDFRVTANLYIPTAGSGPYPGIISPCGHYPTARGYPDYQATYVNFARGGFVVLAYDPIGEGERRNFWNPMTQVNEIGGPVTWEHSLEGQLLLLIGEDLTHFRVWDGMRAIDYLLTRPEVDGKKIGCAGHSGGGTLTKFIAVMDERVACAAINEGGTRNKWPMRIPLYKPMGTGDTEQHLFPSGIYGIDNVDLHAAIAPRPLLVTIEHYSSEFGSAAAAIRARYEQLGAGDKFLTVPADDPHAWTVKLRIANTDWFSRWFYDRPGPPAEAPFTPEPWENLWCTVDGSIRYSRQGQTTYSLILQTQAMLPPERRAPADSSQLETYRSMLCEEIRKIIRYRPSGQPPAPRHDATTPRKGYKIEKLEFLSEPGIYISAWVYKPQAGVEDRTAILYVSDTGRVEDGMEFGLLEQLTLQGHCVVAVDVRGIGATKPPHEGDEEGEFRQVDDADCAMAYMSWEINEDLFGMRVLDVIRSIDYVLSRSDINPSAVRLVGRGAGALWSLYAAALDTRVKALVAHEGLLSYRALTSVDRYLTESSLFIRNVLTRFDLPQVAAAVAERPVSVLAPRGPMKEHLDLDAARRAYRWTEQVYGNLGIKDRFRISELNPETSLAAQYLELLRIS